MSPLHRCYAIHTHLPRQSFGHAQFRRLPLLRFKGPHVCDTILSTRHKFQSLMCPLYRIDRVRVRFDFQYPFRALFAHQIDADVMISRTSRQEFSTRRKRSANHLGLAGSNLFHKLDGLGTVLGQNANQLKLAHERQRRRRWKRNLRK